MRITSYITLKICIRYLKTGFEMAKSIGSIDMVVFLGDLLDEGMEATDEEFSNTVSRFQSIFNQGRLSVGQ